MTKSKMVGAILAGIVCVGISQAALVGEWNFDSQDLINSGSSLATHDGVLLTGAGTNATVGSPTFSTDTPSGSGYALDLTSTAEYMMVTNSTTSHSGYVNTFDAAADFTYSMWARNTDGTWNPTWQEWAGKGSEANHQGWAMRSKNGNNTRVSFYHASEGDDDAIDGTGVEITDQVWHLYTYTYDSTAGALILYIDGVEVGSDLTATMADAMDRTLVFGARDDGTRNDSFLFDNIQFYDEVLSAAAVSALYIPQVAFYVNPDDLALELTAPSTLVTGSVAVSYNAPSGVDVNISLSNQTHSGAFTILTPTSLTLTDPSPSNSVVEFQFDNTVAGLTNNAEIASCTAIIAWNEIGNAEVTEVQVPISLTYEVIDENNWITFEELGSSPAAVNPIDLTAEGTTDWVMLGQGGDSAVHSEKAGADNISEVAIITGNHAAWSGNAYRSSWTDGTPTVSATDAFGSWEAQTLGATMSFSVTNLPPAKYALTIYASKYRSIGDLTATIGVESYNVTYDTGGTAAGATYGIFTLDFPVETVGDSLDVTFTATEVGHSTYGNVGITAMTLKYTGELDLDDPEIGNISMEIVSGGTEASLSWGTTAGYFYGVKASGNLAVDVWDNIISNVPGTGAEVTVTNTLSTGPEFYRAYIQD